MSLPLLDRFKFRVDVDDIVLHWARNNLVKIIKAYAQKGGWEGWAQVEIATVTVSREVAVYLRPDGSNSPMLADIVVEFESQGITDCIIIELKCESSSNTSPIAQRVKSDVDKLHGGIKGKYGHALEWAFGFSGSEAGHAGMETADMSTTTPAGNLPHPRKSQLLYPEPTNRRDPPTQDEMSLRRGEQLTEVELTARPKIALWWLEEERARSDQLFDAYRNSVSESQARSDGTYHDVFYSTPQGGVKRY